VLIASFLGTRRFRPLFLLVASGAAGSCGKDNIAGPPDDPPGDPPPGTVAVASVDLAPSALNLAVGQTFQLTATARAADGSALADRSITWTTGDAAIATISETGMVTAVATGDVLVTATSEGRSSAAAVTVSDLAVATVEVIPSPSSVALGRTAQLTAVPKAADSTELIGRAVAWTTSDPAVATVSESGLVTGVAAGDATISATSEGKTGSTQLTVSLVPVAAVEVAPATASIAEGATVRLTATAKDANGSPLAGRPSTWSTSNANVARVNSTGRVTGIGAGSATITATIEGIKGTATVTVTAATGTVRTWKGGVAGKPTDWSTAGNWTPAGKPMTLDTVRVPAVAHAAVLREDVQVARLIVGGGRVRTAGHRLLVKAP
jgi:trimeric autotransporter adhesin